MDRELFVTARACRALKRSRRSWVVLEVSLDGPSCSVSTWGICAGLSSTFAAILRFLEGGILSDYASNRFGGPISCSPVFKC